MRTKFLRNRADGENDEDMDDDVDDDDEFAFLSSYERERQKMNDQIKQLEQEVMDEESEDDTNMSNYLYNRYDDC